MRALAVMLVSEERLAGWARAGQGRARPWVRQHIRPPRDGPGEATVQRGVTGARLGPDTLCAETLIAVFEGPCGLGSKGLVYSR